MKEIIFSVIGGLGMSLFGMQYLSQGLTHIAGARLKHLLKTLTGNRFWGVFWGALATMVVQSSSVITVMTVSFVNAGLMQLNQAIAVILGANIGTTVTAQIIAFPLQEYALLIVGLGAPIFIFSRREFSKAAGEILFGFGILFFGLYLMQSALAPLSENSDILNFFFSFGEKPLFGVLAGLMVTAIIQSSAAAVSMTIALAVSGLMSLPGAVAFMLGANIGTTMTAIFASLSGSANAKRAALIHFLFNVFGVLAILPFFSYFVTLVSEFSPSSSLPREIANAHTFFNIISVILILPFTRYLSQVTLFLIPENVAEKSALSYLEKTSLENASVALDQVDLAVLEMADLVKESLKLTRGHLLGKNMDFFPQRLVEDQIDGHQVKIIDYLNDVLRERLRKQDAERLSQSIHIVNSLEKMGDFTYRISKIFSRTRTERKVFSVEQRRALSRICLECEALLAASHALLRVRGGDAASEVLQAFSAVHGNIRQVRQRFEQRYTGPRGARFDAVSGNYFLHVLGYLDDFAKKCRNIAYIIEKKRGVETDEY